MVIRTLVTGYGYWGSVLTSNLLYHPGFFVAGVHDPDTNRRTAARSENLYTFRTLQDAIDATTPQLVVITSPIGTQVEAAMMALSRYANVMIAKPGATCVEDIRRIDDLAKRKHRTAVIDYTMRHAIGFQELRNRISGWGEILDVATERNAIGSRSSSPILHDLMVHDIALLHSLNDESWRVRRVERADHRLTVRLETDRAVAVLRASTDAIEAKRTMRVACAIGETEWDQLALTVGPSAVQRSLTDMRARIEDSHHDMTLEYRVTETMEQIEAA